ncbi:MAG: DUF5719 family protein [Actinomycetota bacterium]|nr:DUF5719 family protein [Actinomycetota bacterium]
MSKEIKYYLLVIAIIANLLCPLGCFLCEPGLCSEHNSQSLGPLKSSPELPTFSLPGNLDNLKCVPGEILVRFKENAGAGKISETMRLIGASSLEKNPYANFDLIRLRDDSKDALKDALEALRHFSFVAYAEPNYIRSAASTALFPPPPNDPDFNKQWNFDDPSGDADINVIEAWSDFSPQGGSSQTIIAVLDTGIAYENYGSYSLAPDLSNTEFSPGYDFINKDSHPNDDNGHGTHVAGTIAQSTNNSIGVAGVAFNCKLMPVKVLDKKGDGADSAIASGIRYSVDNGADILNMSLCGEAQSEVLEEAIDYAYQKGAVVCAASGNNGTSSVSYPAAYPACIAVGATNRDGTLTKYSNYGYAIDVVAPGGEGNEGILQQTFKVSERPSSGFAFKEMIGTSMACPHVAGVSGLVKSIHPSWSQKQIKAAILATAKDTGEDGWDAKYGFGLLDAGKACAWTGNDVPSPSMSSISPNHGTSGENVSVSIKGKGFSSPMKICLAREGEGTVAAKEVSLSGSTGISCRFELSGAQPGLFSLVVENAELEGAILTGSFQVDSSDLKTWYLAEGSTAWGYEEFILVENPREQNANVEITFMTPEGPSGPVPLVVPPRSRSTLNCNNVIPGKDISARVTANCDIIVERAMYWSGRLEGTDCIGVQAPSYTWYLAEGSTAHGFSTYLLVQNPNSQEATVWITYMTPDGPVGEVPFKIAANSRRTVNVNERLREKDCSFRVSSDMRVIAERSMYWDGNRGGHVSTGTTQPSQSWYLAEGATSSGFDEWVLLQNPCDSDAQIELSCMTPEGTAFEGSFTLSSGSRYSVHVNEVVPGRDVSVRVSSSVGVIVERAMYWNNGTGKAGHACCGISQPRETCFLAEGSTAWGFEEWVLVMNPNDEQAMVTIEYHTSNGPVPRESILLAPFSRTTIFVNKDVPMVDVSTEVIADIPIIAERAMYWNSRGGGHASTGLMR